MVEWLITKCRRKWTVCVSRIHEVRLVRVVRGGIYQKKEASEDHRKGRRSLERKKQPSDLLKEEEEEDVKEEENEEHIYSSYIRITLKKITFSHYEPRVKHRQATSLWSFKSTCTRTYMTILEIIRARVFTHEHTNKYTPARAHFPAFMRSHFKISELLSVSYYISSPRAQRMSQLRINRFIPDGQFFPGNIQF